MNDTFYELLIKKNKPDTNAVILSAINIVAIVFLLILSLYIQFAIILAVGLGFVFYYMVYPRISVEYEYSLLNADLTIDAIYNKTKRKNVLNVDLKTLETAFPTSSPKMNSQRNGKKTDCSTGDMASSYCLIFPNNGENILLFVTPDDKACSSKSIYVKRGCRKIISTASFILILFNSGQHFIPYRYISKRCASYITVFKAVCYKYRCGHKISGL